LFVDTKKERGRARAITQAIHGTAAMKQTCTHEHEALMHMPLAVWCCGVM